jgi:DNA-binding CsgD family transcriptional regulator
MGVMLLYSFVTSVRYYRLISEPARKKLALRFLLSFGILLPYIFYDIIVTMMFSPVFFLVLVILFNHHFLTHSLHEARHSKEGSGPEQEKSAGTCIEELSAKYMLSPREQEVLLLLLQGLTNQNIGERLFISPNTVKTHISNIYQKIGVNRRYDLLALCKDLKLPPESIEEEAS